MTPDQELIQAVQKGEKYALEQLIRRFQRLVGHIVFSVLPDKRDREEACQDIFLKVYNSIQTFKGESSLATWIGRIAMNFSLNYKRRFMRHQREVVKFENDDGEDGKDEFLYNQSGDFDGPMESFEKNQRAEMLGIEIGKLPEQFGLALTLYHIDEMDIREIAAVMKIPEGTVKSNLFRGRKMLKEKFEKKYKLEEL